MFEIYTPDFLKEEKSMHRDKRNIHWKYFGLILFSPNVLAHMAARNITVEEILSRNPRFVVSGPIINGIAIGAGTIATAGATAHFVAKEETRRVV